MINIPIESIKELRSYISAAENISIITHTNPDGDTIGASLALYNLLIKLEKKVHIIVPDEVPDFLQWLPSANEIIDFSVLPENAKSVFHNSDLIFCVDYNAAHRTGKFAEILSSASVAKIMIDHHLFPDIAFFNLLFSYPEASSTSELLFDIIKYLEMSHLVDQSVAIPLFVGIMTDTGSFAHSSDRKEVFEASAELISLGDLKVKEIHDRIYNNFKENRLRFLGYCLNEKLVVYPMHKSAFISVTLAEMKRFGVSEGDLEGLVNYALSIEGVEFAVLIKEKAENVKLSFRSKSNFNVNKFARDFFEGGGHFHAAGGKSSLTVDGTIKKMEDILKTIEI